MLVGGCVIAIAFTVLLLLASFYCVPTKIGAAAIFANFSCWIAVSILFIPFFVFYEHILYRLVAPIVRSISPCLLIEVGPEEFVYFPDGILVAAKRVEGVAYQSEMYRIGGQRIILASCPYQGGGDDIAEHAAGEREVWILRVVLQDPPYSYYPSRHSECHAQY
tara:strand:+ start:1231 stop:1722 length:492 start_codon:yes stop_codon:yes gene_type:complete